MNTALRASVLALTLMGSAAALESEATWYADFDEAQKAAVAEDKHMLVDFTGSDWCGWCIRLDNEVFEHDEFLNGVKDDFVLVKLDYPNGEEAKAKVPNPERNQELVAEYGIRGYPTILLMTSEGDVFGRTGYQAGGPEAYVNHLTDLTTSGMKTLTAAAELLEAYAKAEGEAKAKVLADVFAFVESLEEGSPVTAKFMGIMRDTLANQTGELQLKALGAIIAAGEVDAETVTLAQKLDPKNDNGHWFDALAALMSNVADDNAARAAIPFVDAFHDAGLELPEADKSEFYFMAAVYYHLAGRAAPEGASDEEKTKVTETNKAKAKMYAEIAKPLWTDPGRVDFLDNIINA